MRGRRAVLLAGLVALALAAGCASEEPAKVEPPNSVLLGCSTDKTYPDYAPISGCTCKDVWTYNDKKYCGGSCGNPDADANGPWCFTAATCQGSNWSYCAALPGPTPPGPGPQPSCDTTTTYPGYRPATGCTCKSAWSYAGKTFCNATCANPDSDASGPWCYTTATCNGQNWSYCTAP